MSSSFLKPESVLEILNKKYSRSRIFIRQIQAKKLYTRFAQSKIVQNMFKNETDSHLVFIDPENRIAERSLGGFESEAEVLKLGAELTQEAIETFPLDYEPKAIANKGSWGEGQMEKAVDLDQSSKLIGGILKQGSQEMDNVAGLFSNIRQKEILLSSDGGNLSKEDNNFSLEMSGFKGINEISYSKNIKDLDNLDGEEGIKLCLDWSKLPSESTKPGSYPVVLSSEAFAQILAYSIFIEHFNARAVRD